MMRRHVAIIFQSSTSTRNHSFLIYFAERVNQLSNNRKRKDIPMRDIHQLLNDIDRSVESDSLATRHLWLIEFVEWIRDSGNTSHTVQQRIVMFLDICDAQPKYEFTVRNYWQTLTKNIDVASLFADFGFAPRSAFLSAFASRLRRKVVPKTPETTNAAELFELVFTKPNDAQWLTSLDQIVLQRVSSLLSHPSERPQLSAWESSLLDSITYCASQISAAGFSAELRPKQNGATDVINPFEALTHWVQTFKVAFEHRLDYPGDVKLVATQLSECLESCRLNASSIYAHLQEHGVSISIVFQVRQLRERIVRLKDLIDCLLCDSPRSNEASTARLLSRMVGQFNEMSSIRALINANTSLLASKITKHSAETGEQYITRDASQYRKMLSRAFGGGAIVSLTTGAKFALAGVAASVFWDGVLSSMNYAISFIIIQLLHLTLATKQPAMTATAIAAKLKDVTHMSAITEFVDEVAHLVRSQFAAVFGNLLMVIPCVLLINFCMEYFSLGPIIDNAKATKVFADLSVLGPSLVFAIFTGFLLFASSIIAGWVENWFVLNRIESALRHNPKITHFLGAARADSWARFWRKNISGIASCVSLALLLGLVPAFATFFGLGVQVRHVTLSAGQLAAAAGSFGSDAFLLPAFWMAVASIPLIGLANIGVSFYCAFKLAIKANGVSGVDQVRIRKAIFERIKNNPGSFILPIRRVVLRVATLPH
jgi:site-specific recombinase